MKRLDLITYAAMLIVAIAVMIQFSYTMSNTGPYCTYGEHVGDPDWLGWC